MELTYKNKMLFLLHYQKKIMFLSIYNIIYILLQYLKKFNNYHHQDFKLYLKNYHMHEIE